MSAAKPINGKAFAEQLRAQVAAKVTHLKKNHNLEPGLAVILVGEDPASQIYVRNKRKQASECGIRSIEYKLSTDTTQKKLLDLIDRLNEDDAVHGILVQLPLPKHINETALIDAIAPNKDVDGFHVINTGRLTIGADNALIPCTPMGALMLIKDVLGENLSGQRALVLGRSNIVGKPMATLLLKENCTVTICHSRTRNLAEECRRADILVVAIGRAHIVKGDWIKPGAVVIDVGINRIPAPEKGKDGTRLVGDVNFNEAIKVANAITPVPGGVGPMTIACLLRNTVIATYRQVGLSNPDL